MLKWQQKNVYIKVKNTYKIINCQCVLCITRSGQLITNVKGLQSVR